MLKLNPSGYLLPLAYDCTKRVAQLLLLSFDNITLSLWQQVRGWSSIVPLRGGITPNWLSSPSKYSRFCGRLGLFGDGRGSGLTLLQVILYTG